MLNQVILVGRLTKDLEVKELDDNKKKVMMTLAIPRSFKNADGEYETDFVPCVLYNDVATNAADCCEKGDIVGVKGRIESEPNKMVIVGEKVTFLSSHKGNN